ncbi:MAG: NADH-quinone oxidoreductase subunit, partial [Frankiaceae bacterium]|nr:NADH-quinone oxidoreductase subunit [Frankiaceae bacterium]
MIRLSSPEAGEAPAEEAAPGDELRESVLEAFGAELGDQVVGTHLHPDDDVWVRVTAAAWREAGLVARDKVGCHF